MADRAARLTSADIECTVRKQVDMRTAGGREQAILIGGSKCNRNKISDEDELRSTVNIIEHSDPTDLYTGWSASTNAGDTDIGTNNIAELSSTGDQTQPGRRTVGAGEERGERKVHMGMCLETSNRSRESGTMRKNFSARLRVWRLLWAKGSRRLCRVWCKNWQLSRAW